MNTPLVLGCAMQRLMRSRNQQFESDCAQAMMLQGWAHLDQLIIVDLEGERSIASVIREVQ